ncbi:TIGR03086 family metal-binding protein [Desertimonas flava]|uniref:TIGR03086 family metal-binding protein n=1 Tax=Desertimonas flava TaxID=2064846 RepID=UPI001968FA7C|nr:TIGR03086 family metal-binding protein [Desertimonas flava]
MVNDVVISPNPVDLYRRATSRAVGVATRVKPAQLADPTPCSAWSVQDLIDHLTGGTEYLLAALERREPAPRRATTAADFESGVASVLGGVAAAGALDRTCMSPLGFEWTIGQAVAGTFMDVLIHTVDLARATGQDERLDPELVDACIAMFLPEMPERGREAGIIGPAVPIEPDAAPQSRLLAAMGRTP